MTARVKRNLSTRYRMNYKHWRFRNLKHWATLVHYSPQKRSPHPLMHIHAISFWSVNRVQLQVNRVSARTRLKFARAEKRRS